MNHIFVLLVLIVSVCAWGPRTHAGIGCLVFGDGKCVSSGVKADSFVMGSWAPDAFKATDAHYHSYQFAFELIEFAQKLKPTKTFDHMAFAIGFAGHLAADAVAHHGKDTVLYPWNKDHELELAIDAHVFWELHHKGYNFPKLSNEAIHFISSAATNSKKVKLTHTDFHTLQSAAGHFWAEMDAERAAIEFMKHSYASMICKNSHCHPKTHGDAAIIANRGVDWSVDAVKAMTQAVKGGKDMKGAVADVDAVIGADYGSHAGSMC